MRSISKGRCRIYSHGKLISWSFSRCKVCGRFLKRYQVSYCSLHTNVTKKNWVAKNRGYSTVYMRGYRARKTNRPCS